MSASSVESPSPSRPASTRAIIASTSGRDVPLDNSIRSSPGLASWETSASTAAICTPRSVADRSAIGSFVAASEAGVGNATTMASAIKTIETGFGMDNPWQHRGRQHNSSGFDSDTSYIFPLTK